MFKRNKIREMNFVSHLVELRKRLVVTMLIFIVFFITSFIFVKRIYGFFESDIDFKLTITGPADTLWVYLIIASVIAIICTLPVLSLQVWLFVKPGLTKTERKVSLSYIPAVFLLFVVGLVFGYILFINLILPFLLSLNDGLFNELFTVDKYFRLLMQMVIPFGVIFEVPIVLMFLTSIGVITPAFLKKNRKYAYFILLIFGGLVTPPDVLLQISVAVPLFLLYELSIYLTAVVYKKKEKRRKQLMKE